MRELFRFFPFTGQKMRPIGRHVAPLELAVMVSVAQRFAVGLVIYCWVAVMPAIDGITPAAAADTQCQSEEISADCQAEMDNRMAVYVNGRNAYDNARKSGDFSEALALSRQLADKGDKNGERLLKMVYLQLGWGGHRDYVQAYKWLSEGIAGGADYLVRWRQILTEKMTADQLAEAKKMAGN